MEQVAELTQEEIAKQAYDEIEAEKEGRELGEPKATPNPDAKKKPETPDADDEPAEASDKDGDDGEGNDKPAEDGDEADEDGVAADKRITEYAEKHKMTYVEAKEDIEKTDEILKQFKNDPAEMARAMRNKDREYHKLRAEAEKAAARKEPAFKRMTDDQYIYWAKEHITKNAETMVAKFRERFPAKSESMSDEAIIEEMAVQSLPEYKEKASAKEAEIKSQASQKRDEMLAGLSDADKRFIPDVKALLQSVSDHDLITSDDLIKDALYMAKGRKYDADIKAAEERGYKRAKEGAQIVGVKPSGEGSKGVKTKVGIVLTTAQKSRAEQMFGHTTGVTGPEDCYKLFRETFEDELKENPKFV